MKVLTLLFIVNLFVFASCDLINPAEPVPAYVRIDSFTIQQTPTLGSTQARITDAYAFIDGAFQGAYPVPAVFPVIGEGRHEMQFNAGIMLNGISNTRASYPLYEPYKLTLDLKQGEITMVSPVIKYFNNVVCAWCEDFENAGVSLVKTMSSDTNISVLSSNDPNNYEGRSGAVFIDASHPLFEVSSASSYPLPKSGQPVYLEMHYKCNHPFIVGIIARSFSGSTQLPVLTVNAKETWNKIYIELAPAIAPQVNAQTFQIFIGAVKQDEITTGYFYFDNLKLLHN